MNANSTTNLMLDMLYHNGFNGFVNTDGSVSYYMPYTILEGTSVQAAEELMTATTVAELATQLGY